MGAASPEGADPEATAVRARKSDTRFITRSAPHAGQATAELPVTSFSNSRSQARHVYS